MAGIYIHIPFCKRACIYCDFHFSTKLAGRGQMIRAIEKELTLRYPYLSGEVVDSVYFGGGTPSLLDSHEIELLITTIRTLFSLNETAEITLEANPDDVTRSYAEGLASTSINRVSLGVQSFYDEDLKWMNRSHNASTAVLSIEHLQTSGMNNVSIDLIYGYPLLSMQKWENNLAMFSRLKLQHLSAYAMTVEKGTALFHQANLPNAVPPREEQSVEQFLLLQDHAKKEGYVAYEISNYCLPHFHGRHNSNYWKGKKYLGVGPSAHSYNGAERSWNVSTNAKYLLAIEAGTPAISSEKLTTNQKFDEFVMTRLRTVWGVNLEEIATDFGTDYKDRLERNMTTQIENQLLTAENSILLLTPQGKLFTDRVIVDLISG